MGGGVRKKISEKNFSEKIFRQFSPTPKNSSPKSLHNHSQNTSPNLNLTVHNISHHQSWIKSSPAISKGPFKNSIHEGV